MQFVRSVPLLEGVAPNRSQYCIKTTRFLYFGEQFNEVETARAEVIKNSATVVKQRLDSNT